MSSPTPNPEDIPDDAWWFRITSNADRYLTHQREMYGYAKGYYESSEQKAYRNGMWDAALKEYSRWVLEAWEKRRAWNDAQGLVFGKDYLLPNMVEELLARQEQP